jgi:hypothetical protein
MNSGAAARTGAAGGHGLLQRSRHRTAASPVDDGRIVVGSHDEVDAAETVFRTTEQTSHLSAVRWLDGKRHHTVCAVAVQDSGESGGVLRGHDHAIAGLSQPLCGLVAGVGFGVDDERDFGFGRLTVHRVVRS